MLDINKYRLNLYELLYKQPLCNFKIAKDGMDKMKVLFIGDKDKAIETYKTMFWASQYPNCRLEMTYYGSYIDTEYVAGYFGDIDRFPAYDDYVKNGYAEKLIYSNDKDKLCNSDSRYIIIATDDAYKDWEYLVNLEDKYGENDSEENKVVLAVYNDGLADKFTSLNWDKVAKNVTICQFENSEEQINESELKRIAANMNLAYSMMYDQRLNIESNLAEFDKLCREEFDFADTNKYDADSSYASAVSISMKLSYCIEYMMTSEAGVKNNNDGIQILSEAIIKNSDLYKSLYYWEHRRWNAYMVMRGYRQPKNEEWDFVYSDNKKSSDIDSKLHVCLCESGKQLNSDMDKPSFWKSIKKNLEPLDYVSYRCNLIAENKTKELQKSIYNKYSFINSVLFRDLKENIENLFAEVGNANDDYKKSYEYYMQLPEVQSNKTIKNSMEQMNRELNVVITRNKHVDFFKYDAQLVQLIPFVLWYGKKYSEVFVFSNGVAASDVIIPTILYAKKAYFVSDKNTDKYKNVVCRYFKTRGNNTEPEFITYQEMLRIVEEKTIDEYVITGEGENKEEFLTRKREVVNLRYDVKNNKINYQNIFVGLNSQNISVREFIQLQGGDIQEEFRDTLPRKTYAEYESLFWKFSRTKQIGNYRYVPWNKVIKIFTKDSRLEGGKIHINQECINLDISEHKTIYVCDKIIPLENYVNNMLDSFLISMSDYCLIGNYSVMLEEDNIHICFLTYHKEICDIVESYEGQDVDCNVAKLALENKNLQRDNLITQSSKKFIIAYENCKNNYEFKIQYYEELLKELKKFGAIYGYEVENGLLRSVTVKDMRIICNLFEKEGDIFEKITYHRFRNSAYFYDVRNGVYFYWNRNSYDNAQQQKKLKKMVEETASNDIAGLIDADTFCLLHNKVYGAGDNNNYKKTQVSNEIDVIATRGMQAYFVSCKAASEIIMGYELEISNHSKNAGAIPVLCSAKKKEDNSDAIISRAKEVEQIMLFGRDELMEQGRFNMEMELIASNVNL